MLSKSAAGQFGTTVILAGLAMLGPFSINTYLPSFGEMALELGTDLVALQLTVSIYFIAFAFMALWHGAISDSFGQRRVVLIGLAVYALASFGCALADRIEQIWVLRAFQGFSAGAGIVIGRAVVRDLHEGPLAQRMMSQVVLMFSVAPALAPVIGGWLQVAFGWRAVFLFLSLLAVSLLLATALRLPESLPVVFRQSFDPRALLQGYVEVFRHKAFMAWAAAYALMFGGSFIYVLSAPIFMMKHLGLAETDFIMLFGPAMVGMMMGSVLAGRFAQRMSQANTLRIGFGCMAAASLYNLLISFHMPAAPGWYLSYLLFFNCGMSLVIPVITMRGLDCVPERRGMGSSVQLAVQTAFNAFLAAILAPLVWGSVLMMALCATALLAASALGVWLAWRMSLTSASPAC